MKRLIYLALLGLALAGCSQAERETSVEAPTPPVTTAPTQALAYQPSAEVAPAHTATTAPAASPLPPMPAVEPASAPAAPVVTVVQPPRDIIYQGELNLAVDDFNHATTSINHLLEQHQAYLSTAHETRTDGRHRQEMTIKVPPARFVELVTALGQLGHVENKDVASADVTADMLQTAQRLANKQATAAKYQRQLAQTTNQEATTRLKEQARQLQLDLAADQAKLQQFGTRSAWATLLLRYYQPLSATDTDEPLPAFAPQFQAAFNRGWSIILNIAVVLTNIWPLFLLGVIGALAWYRWRLRHPEEA